MLTNKYIFWKHVFVLNPKIENRRVANLALKIIHKTAKNYLGSYLRVCHVFQLKHLLLYCLSQNYDIINYAMVLLYRESQDNLYKVRSKIS